MTVRAWLFDADGHDAPIDLSSHDLASGDARRLVWVDLDDRDPTTLADVGRRFGMSDRLARRLASAPDRPALVQYPDHIHLSLRTLEAADDHEAGIQALDIAAGHDWVVTVHDGPVPAIDRILDGMEGETRLGALDAGEFLAALVDSAIAGAFREIEAVDREIDRLDEVALRAPIDHDVLEDIVRMRRRISRIRRVLAPHREAFAVLARPDLALHEELGRPWPGLVDRLEGALDAVEQARASLLGTFDIFMGRTAQRDTTVMKALTVLSAVLLPAVVLAGVMGMNFKLPFFDTPENFWVVIGSMATLAVVVLVIAKARRWA